MSRRAHRVLGGLVVAQFLVWLVTGVMFHVKHRYGEAYESIGLPPVEVEAETLLAPPAALGAIGDGVRVVLLHDWRGYSYAAVAAVAVRVVDAVTGDVRSELDEATAVELWRNAMERSPHRHRYGAVIAASADQSYSARLGREVPCWRLELDSGHSITIARATGEIAHTGPINDFIDWSYRAHYMQYTPWKLVNIAIVLLWVALSLALAGSGVQMLRARFPAE